MKALLLALMLLTVGCATDMKPAIDGLNELHAKFMSQTKALSKIVDNDALWTDKPAQARYQARRDENLKAFSAVYSQLTSLLAEMGEVNWKSVVDQVTGMIGEKIK